MKISELVVNQVYTVPFVVTAATARETRAKKPYLSLEFYDGTDTIQGNYWDWSSGIIPEKNAILNVTAQVSEWQGTKQLNVKGMSINTELTVADFAPVSTNNISNIYKDAYSLASSIGNDFLRQACLTCLEDLQDLWLTVPGAKTVHHAYLAGTLIHSASVARIAKAIAQNIEGADIDLCIAGGLLHDVGKLFAYKINGAVCEMTDEGMFYEHTFLGAEYLNKLVDLAPFFTPAATTSYELLKHIILSHHGKQEYGAAVPPMCLEAHIVSCADGIDATAEQVRAASHKAGDKKFTDKIWTLGNVPQLTIQYVSSGLKNKE